METVEITIEHRTAGNKGHARRLRQAGKVPAVLYGPKRPGAVTIAMSATEFDRKLSHLEGTHLIKLVHADSTSDFREAMVLLRETQRHPVSGGVLHADFYEVDLMERVRVAVPLHFVGKAAGVTAGGVLQPIFREVTVACLPTEIPDYIEVDVTALAIHGSVHVGELRLPTGVEVVGDPAQPVVTVVAPATEAKPGAGEGAAGEAASAAAAPEGGGKK